MTDGETTHERVAAPRRMWVVLLGSVLALLVAQRILYHHAYLHFDPFAHATFSDGQVYEEAARDILAHPPLGSQPFFLQGAYAYFLAAGLSLRGVLSDALLLQLLLAALACGCLYMAARRAFDGFDALVAVGAWLGCAGLAFYENKYLSAELGVAANAALLASFVYAARAPSARAAALLGALSGLTILARPNLLLAVPWSAYALWRCAASRARALRLSAAAALALALSLLPMAARNLSVTGTPSVLPSHGGGIPFYIGNHPGSTGLWNDAGGLISGQVLMERSELAARLGLPKDAPDLDGRIGAALYARAFAFAEQHPLSWAALEARKLWYALGNAELTHDYDWLGEQELLGAVMPWHLPFGVLLGVGSFGLWSMFSGAAAQRRLGVVLLGQLFAVLAANVLWFTSAQNRLPLVVPLALACAAASRRLRELIAARALPKRALIAAAGCTVLSAQAWVSRGESRRPSAAHYYNLANVEESLGLDEAALGHYACASQRNPKQPMFWLRLAHLARRMDRTEQAQQALDALAALPRLPSPIAQALSHERAALATRR